MREFKDKSAFITGGGRGFGLELAKVLAARGVRLMLADIDAAALAEARSELSGLGAQVETVVCDVTDRASMDAAASAATAALGPVHLLFSNAGVVVAGGLDRVLASDWEWVFAVNVIGAANCIAAFLPAMRAHGEPAHIVNTASIAGLNGFPNAATYCSSKAALITLSESLRAEMAEMPIGVTVLCPGWMRTSFLTAGDRRQARFGGPQSLWSTAEEETKALLLSELDAGFEPAVIARLALRGIEDNQFLVVTHAKDREMVAERNDEVNAAYDWLDRVAPDVTDRLDG